MSEDEFSESMDSGGSYPRTESTIFSPEELDKHIDNILHNAGIVSEEDDDLYPTEQEAREMKLDQVLEDIEDEDSTEERTVQEDARMTEATMRPSDHVEEETEISKGFEVSRGEEFSREDYEKIQHEISEDEEEEVLESI